MSVRQIRDAGSLQGKRVLVRVAANVPVADGRITDDFRLRQSLKTIEYVRQQGGKTILISHIEGKGSETLEPVYQWYKNHFPLTFVTDYRGDAAMNVVNNLQNGEVLLFENLRLHKGEKANDINFAKELARYGDLYIFDDFPVAHREQASVVSLPQLLPSYAGIQFIEECDNLARAFDPERPFTFILGGAKFATKEPLIKGFLQEADNVFVGGALMNPLLEARGVETGASLMPEKQSDVSSIVQNNHLLLPEDFVTVDHVVKEALDIEATDILCDIGPASIIRLKEVIQSSSFVLWNGPLGDYENGFTSSTTEIANYIANLNITSIVGGGDTLAAIQKENIEGRFTFISTAGGAMLEFLQDRTLPGIKALED